MSRANRLDVRAAVSHVRVRALPGREPVEMSRDAALHVFRLLQRYNWCLESLDSYQARWATFWPEISAAERLLLVLLVSANCEGQFGRRVLAFNPPVDFERFENDVTPSALTTGVEGELSRVLAQYYGRMGGREQIQDWLRTECPKEFALLASVGGLDRVFNGADWVEPARARRECATIFRGCGWDQAGADALAATLERALMSFYKTREAQQC